MNRVICGLTSLVALVGVSSVSESLSTQAPEVKKEKLEEKKATHLDQRALFDKTRRGVVTIKVSVVLSRDPYTKQWSGTGFIADKEKGLIVTNAHVAGELSVCSYEVKFGNGKKVEAKLEYLDPSYDFAILSVNPKDIPQYAMPLKISDEKLSINTEIYSMGNSANNEFSTYKGYIFDIESILWLKPIAEQSFQFSGLTVPGASGSPVLNTKGEVVGLLYGGKFVSGAALPISYVKPVIETLIDGKKFHRYFCGFTINYGSVQDFIANEGLTEEAQKQYEEKFPDTDKILYVTRKLSAYGAADNKLEAGDIIWEIEGEMIGPRLRRIDEIVQSKKGKSINLTVYRKGKKKELEMPTFELTNSSKMKMLSFAGAIFYETPNEYKICFGKSSTGVYLSDCESGSAFSDVCYPNGGADMISAGAQIVSIDGKDISNLDDLEESILKVCKKKVFTVRYIRNCSDPQISEVTVKHTPEFAEARLYTFNNDKKRWDVKDIKTQG